MNASTLQVAGQLTMVSVVGMALRDIPEDQLKDASGFNNLMRNLGGAVGIAAVNTWLIAFTSVSGCRSARARLSACMVSVSSTTSTAC